MATEMRWHIARCLDCKPVLKQPFTNRLERDEWAETHKAATHHSIEYYAEGALHHAGACHCSLIHSVPEANRLNALSKLDDAIEATGQIAMIRRTEGQEDPLVQEPKS